jgi:hypothetical protein
MEADSDSGPGTALQAVRGERRIGEPGRGGET